jgi:hypothetical protein
MTNWPNDKVLTYASYRVGDLLKLQTPQSILSSTTKNSSSSFIRSTSSVQLLLHEIDKACADCRPTVCMTRSTP